MAGNGMSRAGRPVSGRFRRTRDVIYGRRSRVDAPVM